MHENFGNVSHFFCYFLEELDHVSLLLNVWKSLLGKDPSVKLS
jgi:hypothetical protein